MSAQQQELTAGTILAAASRAYDDLNTHGWGEVYIMFLDGDRTTQAVLFQNPNAAADADDEEDCLYEIHEALQAGWRPVCLQVIPYAEAIVVPLRDDLTVDDQAVIWELSGEEEEENGHGIRLEADPS